MISIKNPLNTQLLIGDVYVRCEIKFLPLCPQNAGEEVLVNQINARLSRLGYEMAAEMSEKLSKTLEAIAKAQESAQ